MAKLLPPQTSLGVALATVTVVGFVYSKALPPVADMRVADSQNRDLSSSERAATLASAGAVAAISLIARDPDIFIIGGIFTIGMAWWHRHANLVDPATGKATVQMRAPELVPETQTQIPDSYGYPGDSDF